MCTDCLAGVLKSMMAFEETRGQSHSESLLTCRECHEPILSSQMVPTLRRDTDVMALAAQLFPENKALMQIQKQMTGYLKQGMDFNGEFRTPNQDNSLHQMDLQRLLNSEVMSVGQDSRDDILGALEPLGQNDNKRLLDEINHELKLQTRRQEMYSRLGEASSHDHQHRRSGGSAGSQAGKWCAFHNGKSVEAYCETCRQLLCMDCILKQNHKSHEMVSVDNGGMKERLFFLSRVQELDNTSYDLEAEIHRVEAFLQKIEQQAIVSRDCISQVYSDVRQRIIDREQTLRGRISELLESQQLLYKQRIENLRDQIRCIKDAKHEQARIEKEDGHAILARAQLRLHLLEQANKGVPQYDYVSSIPQINKEHEIACIVKQILPKSMRSNLTSGTINSHVRLTNALFRSKKKELNRHRQEIDSLQRSDGKKNLASTEALLTQTLSAKRESKFMSPIGAIKELRGYSGEHGNSLPRHEKTIQHSGSHHKMVLAGAGGPRQPKAPGGHQLLYSASSAHQLTPLNQPGRGKTGRQWTQFLGKPNLGGQNEKEDKDWFMKFKMDYKFGKGSQHEKRKSKKTQRKQADPEKTGAQDNSVNELGNTMSLTTPTVALEASYLGGNSTLDVLAQNLSLGHLKEHLTHRKDNFLPEPIDELEESKNDSYLETQGPLKKMGSYFKAAPGPPTNHRHRKTLQPQSLAQPVSFMASMRTSNDNDLTPEATLRSPRGTTPVSYRHLGRSSMHGNDSTSGHQNVRLGSKPRGQWKERPSRSPSRVSRGSSQPLEDPKALAKSPHQGQVAYFKKQSPRREDSGDDDVELLSDTTEKQEVGHFSVRDTSKVEQYMPLVSEPMLQSPTSRRSPDIHDLSNSRALQNLSSKRKSWGRAILKYERSPPVLNSQPTPIAEHPKTDVRSVLRRRPIGGKMKSVNLKRAETAKTIDHQISSLVSTKTPFLASARQSTVAAKLAQKEAPHKDPVDRKSKKNKSQPKLASKVSLANEGGGDLNGLEAELKNKLASILSEYNNHCDIQAYKTSKQKHYQNLIAPAEGEGGISRINQSMDDLEDLNASNMIPLKNELQRDIKQLLEGSKGPRNLSTTELTDLLRRSRQTQPMNQSSRQASKGLIASNSNKHSQSDDQITEHASDFDEHLITDSAIPGRQNMSQITPVPYTINAKKAMQVARPSPQKKGGDQVPSDESCDFVAEDEIQYQIKFDIHQSKYSNQQSIKGNKSAGSVHSSVHIASGSVHQASGSQSIKSQVVRRLFEEKKISSSGRESRNKEVSQSVKIQTNSEKRTITQRVKKSQKYALATAHSPLGLVTSAGREQNTGTGLNHPQSLNSDDMDTNGNESYLQRAKEAKIHVLDTSIGLEVLESGIQTFQNMGQKLSGALKFGAASTRAMDQRNKPKQEPLPAAETGLSEEENQDIFEVQEEFFFVMGGQGAKKETLASIEVFDCKREIWRQFSRDESKENTNNCFSSQLQTPLSGAQSVSFKNLPQLKNKLFLLGGQTSEGHIVNSVQELSVDEMQTYQGDWKLPEPISHFGCEQVCPGEYMIAGGTTILGEPSASVLLVSAVQQNMLDGVSRPHHILGRDTSFLDIIFVASQLPTMSAPRTHFTLTKAQQNSTNPADFKVYAIGGNKSWLIDVFSSLTNSWQPFSSVEGCKLIEGISSHRSVLLPDGNIYIIGGYQQQAEISSSVYKFDVANAKISLLPHSMVQARANFEIELSQDLRFIYCLGGTGPNGQPLRSVEKFDVLDSSWTMVAPMNEQRSHLASASITCGLKVSGAK